MCANIFPPHQGVWNLLVRLIQYGYACNPFYEARKNRGQVRCDVPSPSRLQDA